MRLRWKYTLIINLFIITFMALFFVIDDIKLRKDRIEGQVRDISRGILIRDIADVLKTVVQDLSDPNMIEKELRSVVKEIGVEDQIVDVNVTDEMGKIIASLRGWEIGNMVNIGREGYERISQGRIRIYRLARYHGRWVTEAIITYPRSARFDRNSNIVIENGLIQILFDAPDVANYLWGLRLIHMIYVLTTSISLAFLISLLTGRMVIRPLEDLVEIIQRADEGDLNFLAVPRSKGEIGRVSVKLAEMIRQIKVAHRERIEALRRMASGVAHEIRNPLNSINMTVQYLKSVISPGGMSEEEFDEALECLEIIDKQVKRLNQITDQFLTLNRQPSLQIKPTDLDLLINEVLSEFNAAFNNAGISIIKRYCGELKDVPLDADRIRQAIYNLIQNAIQAMPKGGKIYITTKLERGKFLNRAIVEIRDTGIGIPDEIQPRIFDAYFTTREREGGVGLGLALTLQIVEAHGGKIELKSKIGMGSSFKIILPIR